ncbi:MAG TPA: hypothetical protein VH256_04575 [Thermoleophilaceae bacterium]|jgi:hypothetical protein|nr:hypothetical protein [Thermoleophilaceae bacterium]
MAKKKKQQGDDQPTTITPAGAEDVKLTAHPRARMQIRRWKGIGGMVGFVLMAWLSWRSGTDFVHLGLRALLGGVAAYVVVWTASVYIWRQIVLAEVRQQARIVAQRKFAAMDAAEQQGAS